MLQRAVHGRADARRHARAARLRHHRQAPPGQRPVRQLGRRAQPRRKVGRRLARAGGVGLVRACTPTQNAVRCCSAWCAPNGTLHHSKRALHQPATHTMSKMLLAEKPSDGMEQPVRHNISPLTHCSAFHTAAAGPPLTRDGGQDERGVLHAARERAHAVQRGAVGDQAGARHAPVCRLDAHHAAEVRRLPDAAACRRVLNSPFGLSKQLASGRAGN